MFLTFFPFKATANVQVPHALQEFASVNIFASDLSPSLSLSISLSLYLSLRTHAHSSLDRYYQRLQPRNDAPYKQVVPYKLDVPTRNVSIKEGHVLRTAFENGILYLTQHYSVDDILCVEQHHLVFWAEILHLSHPACVQICCVH